MGIVLAFAFLIAMGAFYFVNWPVGTVAFFVIWLFCHWFNRFDLWLAKKWSGDGRGL